MKKSGWLIWGAVCLALLSGCTLGDGSYISVTAHQSPLVSEQGEVPVASTYSELIAALSEIVSSGAETAAINVSGYPETTLERGAQAAVDHVLEYDPVAAYAVESMTCELGTNVGQPALAVSITYFHSKTEIQRIRRVKDAEAAQRVIGQALENFDASVVLLIENFEQRDYTQMALDYALDHPDTVMETPQITETLYGQDSSRVVELLFSYQNSRDALRRMLTQVTPVFDSADLYVSGDDAQRQKFSQLYAFLMERFDYKIETSLTPAYSLLRHGVGDSRAFASVYAAMCRSAGLDCQVVTGTRNGEPWTWNLVVDEGTHYHVDLLRSLEQGDFREYRSWEMEEYVWDYFAYPDWGGAVNPNPQTPEPTA